ncbi:MAG TPA: glycoside hydrolase family 57 protein [Candidatus Acidoferrales bacterium]
MNRIHLVIYWHMHQPHYRDPGSGRYVMPWTRLHALKDYWGMVKLLDEFPGVQATFNMVPSLCAQLEEYASGQFDEPWHILISMPAEELEPHHKQEILTRAFQVNHENLMSRWPRFVELYERSRDDGAAAVENFGPRDWRDLQVLSQLAWMDEEYLAKDEVTVEMSLKGANYTEEDKQRLLEKQAELLRAVLPAYRDAAQRGQVELSTTPYYHPILPLLCDSDIAREPNPHTPLPQPAFRRPEDAREQLRRAREYHQRLFGHQPAGLWPSEGSVSNQVLEMAAEMGFRWFATDEGVLGRTLGIWFGREASGIPWQAEKLYSPWRVRRGEREMAGLFRDHYLSDLVGFVYSRMPAGAAAEDLHHRIRAIGERLPAESNGGRPVTVSLILDGENAWEYYPGNGREFLRQFYRRMQDDADIHPLTISQAIAQAGEIPSLGHIAAGSWINANFDVWIGHAEDVQAWDWLREARDFYAHALERREKNQDGAPSQEQIQAAWEAVLAAEGSDWCWWYGPEHSTFNDAEFDALYRKHLTAVYASLGAEAPEYLAHPIKRRPERAWTTPPTSRLKVKLDGRESSYFEWLGAGIYSAEQRTGAMHGRTYYLRELQFGFDEENLYLRVDAVREALEELTDFEFRAALSVPGGSGVVIRVEVSEAGRLCRAVVERDGACLLHAAGLAEAAFRRIFELRVARELVRECAQGAQNPSVLLVNVALWEGGLPVDVLPAEGNISIALSEEASAWAG